MNFVEDVSNDLNFGVEIDPTTTIINNNSGPFKNVRLETILWIIVILIIIGLITFCLCHNYFTNKNENITNKKKSVSFKEYNFGNNLIMISNDSCPYSNKMKEELLLNGNKINNKKVDYIQFNSEKGIYLRNTHGILGTPAIINFENNKPLAIVLGFSPLDELIKKLDASNNKSSTNNGNELLLIGNDFCGFCKKQKNLYDSKGIKYRFVDSNSPEGMDFMKKHNSNGVPLLINIVDGKEHPNIGYSESFP